MHEDGADLFAAQGRHHVVQQVGVVGRRQVAVRLKVDIDDGHRAFEQCAQNLDDELRAADILLRFDRDGGQRGRTEVVRFEVQVPHADDVRLVGRGQIQRQPAVAQLAAQRDVARGVAARAFEDVEQRRGHLHVGECQAGFARNRIVGNRNRQLVGVGAADLGRFAREQQDALASHVDLQLVSGIGAYGLVQRNGVVGRCIVVVACGHKKRRAQNGKGRQENFFHVEFLS